MRTRRKFFVNPDGGELLCLSPEDAIKFYEGYHRGFEAGWTKRGEKENIIPTPGVQVAYLSKE